MSKNVQGEPRWPAIVASLAVGGLQTAMPEQFSPGPRWLLLCVLLALTVPAVVARRRGRHGVNQGFGYALSGVLTVAVLWSLAVLVRSLPRHAIAPGQLLGVAGALWASNVLVFASWYWRLDAGGPHARDLRGRHAEGAFLFPQMTVRGDGAWSPGFVDYLFLAFNTSTAFSPTDAPVLSRWAKGLMMVQASISLVTLALLAARAVNIL